MTRAIVLLKRNGDGSETAAGVLQVVGDDPQTASGDAVPNGARSFTIPTGYAESLARQAREAGEVEKSRLEDWVGWIVDEFAGYAWLRALEVLPSRNVDVLYDREITLHPPEGWRPVNDEDDDEELEGPHKSEWLVGLSPITEATDPPAVASSPTAKQLTDAERWWNNLLEESRARVPQPSRVTILVPPTRPNRGHGVHDTAESAAHTEIGPDTLLDLIPKERPGAFDALLPRERALRGRIFLAMWADGYSEKTAWAVALARDVSGVTGPEGFLDISDDAILRFGVETRRAQLAEPHLLPARPGTGALRWEDRRYE